MNRIALPPILALAFLLGACGGSDTEADAGPPVESGPATAEAELSSEPRRLVGIFATGQGFTELEPCDGSAPLALQGPALPNLMSIAEQIGTTTDPVITIFADLVVTLRTAQGTNVGDGYEQIADVLGVRRAAYEGFGCDGPMPSEVALVASGNEPFWRLSLVDDSTAELSRPEAGTMTISVGSLQQDLEGVVLNGSLEGEGTVFLEVTTGTCRDSMSGALTHATATFTVGGRRMDGCAWFGTALDPDVTPVR